MKHFILILTFLVGLSDTGITCSMYKVTEDGKTIVGNNEDWISPNSQFWFVPKNKQNYGVMNVGLLNNFAQGAINTAGLVFDGFANPYLEVNNVADKIKIPIGEVVQHIMHKYNNVIDVKKYLTSINLSSLSSGQLVFVDKFGKYLIVEGDKLIIGNESEKVFSNFYYSQVVSIDSVHLPNVQNGVRFLKNSTLKSSLQYCGSVMKSLSNPEGYTQYSTIYDLEKMTIRVYLYHDFTQFIELDLKKEIAKGSHKQMIAEYFHSTTKGHLNYMKYNDPENPTAFIKSWIGDESRKEKDLVDSGFSYNINNIAYEWLYDKNEPFGAIEILKYATELMPNEANLFDSLGEAYLINKNYKDAIINYAISLTLNPKNINAINMLKRIEKESSEANR